MKIYDDNNQELMQVRAIDREGNRLVIRGKIFGAMPMVAKISPNEARAALKLLDYKTMIFIVSLLFRRGN